MTGGSDGAAVDLSMNETPFPPLPSVAAVVAGTNQRLNRYPHHLAGPLVEALARRYAVPAENILVGPGSAGLCQHLVGAFCASGGGAGRPEVVHAALSFEAYPLIAANAGARPVPVPMAGYRHDLAAMAAAVTDQTRCVLVCSPNNPTGAIVRRAEMKDFLSSVPSQVPVILDEAYREFVTDPDAVDGVRLLDDHPNVVVLRTFSKAYGLAALRVGYAIGAPALVGAARMMGMMFFPSGPGQHAAAASLQPPAERELAARCATLVEQRTRLRDALIDVGLPVAPSEGNFLWLDIGERAVAFADACREAAFLVRPYPNHGVRVTIGTAEENDRFVDVARRVWS